MSKVRRDIQGLRALAVVSVVIYHLWPSALPGGFIGVDIFFVISGFLITAHMLREVDHTGSISLSQFWARRIRRLLPASFLVLAVCLVLSLTVMFGVNTRQNLSEIGGSALYIVNWVLANNAVDYLAAENSASLVQHFWSLSVEEQFYVAWPLILLLTVFIGVKTKRNRDRSVLVVLACIFVVSFALSIWITATNPAVAYFATYVRAWEFAAGGLIVFLARVPLRSNPFAHTVASWIAVAAIVVPAFVYNSGTPFPGWTAAIPVAGVSWLLAAGDVERAGAPQWLAHNRPVQFLGDVSYSLYLWHWPLIVAFPAVIGGEITVLNGVAIATVAILLAGLTKRFIEDPFRGKVSPIGTRPRTYSFMVAGMAAVLVTQFFGDARLASALEEQRQVVAAVVDDTTGCYGDYALDNDCDTPYAVTNTVLPLAAAFDNYENRGAITSARCSIPEGDTEQCELGELDNPTRTVALLGDSHARHLSETFDMVGKSLGWKVITIGEDGCGGFGFRNSMESDEAQEQSDECAEWSDTARAQLVENDEVSAVFIGQRAHTKSTTPEQAASAIQPMLDSGKQVAIITDPPGMPAAVRAPECIEQSRDTEDPCAWTPPESNAANFLVDAANMLNLPVIDLRSRTCSDDGTCHAVVGGAIIYSDNHHIATSYAHSLGPWMTREVERALG